MRHNFKRLEIWKRAMNFVQEIYMITRDFPKEERFGLTAQLRASSVSIPSNIAEGCGRSTNSQLVYFLDVSIGSNCEAETQLILAFNLGYLSEHHKLRLTEELCEIRQMTISFQEKYRV